MRWRSPPESFIPLSPIVVSSPFPARATIPIADAFSIASSISASVASGFTNCRFSRSVPEKSCVSCVTKPNWRRTGLKRMSFVEMPL